MIALAVICAMVFPGAAAVAQEPGSPEYERAQALLNNLTPEERIGQLFLITFQGSTVPPESPIYDLIHNHHIGGVVLLSKNDNIVPSGGDPTSVPSNVQALIRDLQKTEWDASQNSQINPVSGFSFLPSYIPLFVAVTQEGNGSPYDQILLGLTPLPNQMAIGATWKPGLASQVGQVLGQELSALGFNLLLGPSLDVLDLPQIEITNNLGTRTFGGDPFWVGEMGRSFISGIHKGSQNRLAVVSKHFPGHGGSDRLPEEEVATVRKSLDELKTFDLAPFFVVTGNAVNPEETSDALLTSHIRYQGLQGNIRATTRPVSLDPQALGLLMELPGLVNWRSNGGILISDDLGSLAIRRFYELTNQSFDPRRVALNAFLAGNDVLHIADFSTHNNLDTYEETLRTLDFFAQKYREDSAFAQRVDESVLRILMLKRRLYPDFSWDTVNPESSSLEQLGKNSTVTFETARTAATLLSPSQAELDTNIPDPPDQNDRIVFIVDTKASTQCSICPEIPILSRTSMQDAVVRLYGPQAGGQISLNNLSSYSLRDLLGMLDSKTTQTELENDLIQAHWIILIVHGDQEQPNSFQTLRRFLAERPDLFQQKRLIVFAMTSPYFLDATNISKLTAYYALYSKEAPFIDTAAYLLFGELRATGSPPVSVPGIGYFLNEVLFPNPELPILLEFDFPAPPQTNPATTTPEPTPPPEFRIGEVIPLRTGVIKDHNGNPVPDGSPVTFIFTYSGETTSVRQTAFTQKGVARTTFNVTNAGKLEISAESENARSQPLQLDIPRPNGELPTETPTNEPTPTPTLTPPTPTPEPTLPPVPPVEEKPQMGIGEWLVAMLLSFGVSFLIYRLVAIFGNIRWAIRAGFLALIGGLVGYIYLALRMPENLKDTELSLYWIAILVSLGGILTGTVAALVWRTLQHTFYQVKRSKAGSSAQ